MSLSTLSSETGMAMMGGHALYLASSDIQLGVNENMSDTGTVLSRMNDVILARVTKHTHLKNLSNGSRVPVINALSDTHHPLQILADLQTLTESFGGLRGLTVAWVGDSNNILNTYLSCSARMGINLRVAHPYGYGPRDDIIALAKRESTSLKTGLLFTKDPEEAVKVSVGLNNLI